MITYRATVDVSRELAWFLAKLLLARISAAADPASAALAGAAEAAVKSPITIWQVQARSQARSPGRRATWRASGEVS